jgi:regulator of cell morphogenesis and NO signaling
MSITKEKTVAEVVTENMGADHVFSKYKIDFCCGGHITLETACKESGIEFKVLKKEIEEVTTIITSDNKFSEMNVVSLINHAQNVYHKYFNDTISQVSQLAVKVSEVHWREYKEVIEINNLFNSIVTELIEQIAIEKNILFPFIERFNLQENTTVKLNQTELETLNRAIQNIENAQKQETDTFKKIEKLTGNYTLPKGACNTYKLLYESLQKLELELHKYIHFEINVLFPRVLSSM